MADLRQLLSEVDRISAPDLWQDIVARRPRKASVRSDRLIASVVALALAAGGLVLVSRAFFGGQERPIIGSTAGEGVEPRITAEIEVGQFPQEVAIGEGAVWITVNDADPPERWFVARIDPATNRVTDEIDLPDAVDVAVGSGSIWAITYDETTGWAVARIDPNRRDVVDVIALDCDAGCGPSQVAATDDAVWVTLTHQSPDRGEIVRIDPAMDQVAARIAVSGDPRDIAIGEGAVWVYALTHFEERSVVGGSLYRVDPSSNAVSAALMEGEIPPVAGVSGPPVLTVGDGYVWTIRLVEKGPDEELVRIDPRTDEVEGLGILGTFHPFGVWDGGVWLRSSRHPGSVLPVAISRLDTETLELDESVDLDELAVDAALDPTAGTIWLATYEGPVVRIDLR
jgi:hypothetical protein